MRAIWIAAILAAAAAAAERQFPDVVVYLHHGTQSAALISPAEAEAAAMLAGAGVSVRFRAGATGNDGGAEVIEAEVLDWASQTLRPGCLGFSTLGLRKGARITILFNRVASSGPPLAVPSILAHVLVHEITHVLQGVSRHSPTGVMKALWSAEDFQQMHHSTLPFAEVDVRLIREWKIRRTELASGR